MNSHNTDPGKTPAARDGGGEVWTEERIRALGAITDLPTAGRVFGLGRALSYELARTGGFPVPVIRVGARYKVPVAGILTALGLQPPPGDLTPNGKRSVDHQRQISSIDPPHSGGDGKAEP
ncbi:DNA-binding protein [Micromonospora sp. KC207]|uniref:DNA-binding protein n=1 Tax=Micromonospora sp. KC207 TaxID=2530377 RepID=UPI001FB5B3CE|nr:DNA-binding protein [Micromonospora sp. KC207]